jgi:hypothetical protein
MGPTASGAANSFDIEKNARENKSKNNESLPKSIL